jgi:hypothetical protein
LDVETSNPCAEIPVPNKVVTGSKVVVTTNVVHGQTWHTINPVFLWNVGPPDPLNAHWHDMPSDSAAQAFLKAMRGLKLLQHDDVKEAAELIDGYTLRIRRRQQLHVSEVKKANRIRRERPFYDRRAMRNPSMKGRSYNGR